MTRRSLGVAVLVGILALLTPVSSTPAAASYPGRNGYVAVSLSATPFRHAGIFAADPEDGSLQPVLISPDERQFASPVWSPDGTMIAFGRQFTRTVYHLWVVKADGTGSREISSLNMAGNPSWSPDGLHLAFGALVDEIPQLFTVNLDGTQPRQLTDGPTYSAYPQWSPTGSPIYFTSPPEPEAFEDLHAIEPDGTNNRVVLEDRFDGFAVSPDGATLAVGLHVDGLPQVHVMPVAGGQPGQITDEPKGAGPRSFSPDGSRILFVTIRNSDYPSLASIALDGSDDRFVVRNEQSAGAGDWGVATFLDTLGTRFEDDSFWALDAGITRGCGVARFCPNQAVTREQLASLLARALDLPPTDEDFFDDDYGSVHEADTNRVAAAGLMTGCGAESFCPDAVATRGQVASVLARAFNLQFSRLDFFRDDSGSPHEGAINRLGYAGLTHGCTSTRFCPSNPMTRWQIVAILHRALG